MHTPAAASGDARAPRVLLFSERNIDRAIWQTPQYEFEDVIAEVDSVRLLAPPSTDRSEAQELLFRMRNQGRKQFGKLREQPIASQKLDGEYDLFFAVFHFAHHLSYMQKFEGWRARCRKAVAFIIELWPPEVQSLDRYLELLRDFDHVFIFNASSADPVARISGRPTEFMPTAVDALRFTPLPSPPERTIDVYSYGRRSAQTHRQLVAMAQRRELFYVYDTMKTNSVFDHRDHRALLADFVRRSRYVLSYRINENEDRRARTGGDEGLTTRLFELTAGGAVLLGSATRSPQYESLFDWPDATIEIPYDPPDIGAILAELDAQPERIAAARRNNVVNALRRHDWVYRWAQVLDAVGLPHSEAMRRRIASLHALADRAAEREPLAAAPRAATSLRR
jgi:hypothetical protein